MGRPQFETVVAQAPREYLKTVTVERTTPLGAGQSEIVQLFAPVGFVAELVGVRIDCPNPIGATSGSQFVFVSYIVGAFGNDLLYGESTYVDAVRFLYNHWSIAPVKQYPPGAEAQGNAMRSIKFDDQICLQVFFQNSSNAAINNTRKYYFSYKVKQVAK